MPNKLKFRTAIWLIMVMFAVNTESRQLEPEQQNHDELAEWIMRKVVEKAIENEKLKRQYITYDKYQVTEDLTKQPPVKTEEIFNIYGENGYSMERRIRVNNRSIRERSQRSQLDFTTTLADRYLPRMIFRKIREEIINGRGYFVITFEPKAAANELPSNDLYDRGINRSSGTIYIDMENFSLWKFESRLTEKFSAYVLGQAEDFQLYVEQEDKFGIMVPKKVVTTIKYKFLWVVTHERKTSTYDNHRDSRNPAAQ